MLLIHQLLISYVTNKNRASHWQVNESGFGNHSPTRVHVRTLLMFRSTNILLTSRQLIDNSPGTYLPTARAVGCLLALKSTPSTATHVAKRKQLISQQQQQQLMNEQNALDLQR